MTAVECYNLLRAGAVDLALNARCQRPIRITYDVGGRNAMPLPCRNFDRPCQYLRPMGSQLPNSPIPGRVGTVVVEQRTSPFGVHLSATVRQMPHPVPGATLAGVAQ